MYSSIIIGTQKLVSFPGLYLFLNQFTSLSNSKDGCISTLGLMHVTLNPRPCNYSCVTEKGVGQGTRLDQSIIVLFGSDSCS